MVLAIRILSVVSGLAGLAIIAAAGDFSSPLLWVAGLMFLAWVALPFALAFWFAPGIAAGPIWGVLLFVAVAAAALFGLYAYYDTFFGPGPKDAQDGLIMLVVPFFQLTAIGTVVVLHGLIAADG